MDQLHHGFTPDRDTMAHTNMVTAVFDVAGIEQAPAALILLDPAKAFDQFLRHIFGTTGHGTANA